MNHKTSSLCRYSIKIEGGPQLIRQSSHSIVFVTPDQAVTMVAWVNVYQPTNAFSCRKHIEKALQL